MRLVRRALAPLNLAATLMLVAVLFILVNWIASRRYARWDLSQLKLSRLSSQTLQVLKSLQEPVTVTVFYQPDQRLYELIRDLLEAYQRQSPQMRVEYIDPEQDLARARQLAQQLEIKDLNVIIFQAGTRQKYLSDPELAEYDYSTFTLTGEPRVAAFKGEDAVTSAILSVSQSEQPLVWFLTGHGEKSLDAAQAGSLTQLRQALEQQNLKLESVTLADKTDIPAEVKLLAIIGPTRRLMDSELAVLDRSLDRGGRLLALLDPATETGLEPLLERWGILLARDIVVDPSQQLPFGSAANLFVTTYTQHPIVSQMKMLMTLFPLARSVRPAEPAPEGLTVQALALTSSHGWGETTIDQSTFQFEEGNDLKGPVSVAVAAERAATEPPARLVVFGDSEFVMDGQVTNVGNRDLILGACRWLIQQEHLIGIAPKRLETVKLSITNQQLTTMLWMSLFGMPLLCGLVGGGVLFSRRR